MMKKTLFIVLAVALCLSMATIAMAGVSGSPHDPRVAGTAGPSQITQVCESCHAPHNNFTLANGFLWNRNRDHITTAFTTYASPTQDMATDASLLGYQSRLCFSCHDGLAADVNQIPRYPLTATTADWTITVGSWAALDTDLSNDHPVGFQFNSTLDKGSSGLNTLVNSTTAITGFNNATIFPLFPVGTTTGTFQCSTCHTVHDTATYAGKGVSEVYFLRTGNIASFMCAECHHLYY
jgi:hypothetical protein